MKLIFKNVPFNPSWVNTVIITTKDGTQFVLDRETTEYKTNKKGKFNVTWKNVYLWRINNVQLNHGLHLSKTGMRDILDSLKKFNFEFDDECDEDSIDTSGITLEV